MNDPLYAAAYKERFASTWWVTTRPEEVDSALMQGIRRNILRDEYGDEAHDDEEVA